jgi:Fe-S cluster biogenesis protein NfuA
MATGWSGAGGNLEQRVLLALEEVRPALHRDGGDVELVSVDGATVTVRLVGACHGCPMAAMTLVQFVEERIRLFAPEVERVVRL